MGAVYFKSLYFFIQSKLAYLGCFSYSILNSSDAYSILPYSESSVKTILIS